MARRIGRRKCVDGGQGRALPATPQAAPCPISAAALKQPGLIVNPWASGALSTIGANDRVLIVGTGLTMADVIVTLDRTGHQGPITAVSRRALLPRQHGPFVDDIDLLDGAAAPKTALELLRLVRGRVREAAELTTGWQPIVDALRARLWEIWPALPAQERRRAARWLLPYWEVHRFRMSPQVHGAVTRKLASNQLTIERAGVISIDSHQGLLTADLRMRNGTFGSRSYEFVVLCAGSSRNLPADPLFADMLDRGSARMDEAGLGLDVDRLSRVLDARGRAQTDLLAVGPMTRGCFGEMTGAPDIARHIERIAHDIVSSKAASKQYWRARVPADQSQKASGRGRL